ncbi:MAG: ThuA domain-containing protein [Planctomycetes bacterium]|nr:ThuA domain-containing protein [Planctomycetota bacterium]
MLHRTIQAFCCFAAILFACAPLPAQEKPAARKKVLYITTTAGFHHSTCEYSIPIIKKIAGDSGDFEVACSDKTDLINRPSLEGFDAVVFSNTTGDLAQFPLSEENRGALIDFVKGGKAFIGIHAATDTYKDWAPFYEMIGGSFNGHPWHEKVTIDVEDPSHPAASPVPSPWAITDEIYTFKNYSRDQLHVILRLDKASEKGKGNRPDGDYALAWSKTYGKGSVFYTALGHREDVWDNPLFQKHLLGGIRWALGLAKTNLQIGHPRVESDWAKIFDGKTLDFGSDWEATDNPEATRKHWTVQPGGILQGTGEGSSHLYHTKRTYKNFECRADICIDPNGNSGFYFRCSPKNHQANGQWKNWPEGYEAQINNGYALDPKRSGTFYPSPTLWDKDIKKYLGYEKSKDDGNFWFNMHMVAAGNHFVIKLNGQVVVDHFDDQFSEGYFAFQMHHTNSRVKLKNIEVRELP